MLFPFPNSVYLKTASRASALAKAQVIEAQKLIHYFYPELTLEPIYMDSQGDRDKTTSLRSLEKTNFFTDTLDEALLEGRVRLAIHSAKDLPSPLDPSLEIAALTPCIDERDALVFAPYVDYKEKELKNLRVATSSKRREEAVCEIVQNPIFSDLRGTIAERLSVLETGKVDGVVIAEAALKRLGLEHLPRLFLKGKTVSGQGSLAFVVKKNDVEMINLFSAFDIRQNRPRSIYLGIDPDSHQKKTPFTLTHLPIIETQSLLEIDAQCSNQALIAFEKASHILVTSPRSAKYLSEWISKKLGKSSLGSKIWWCMGDSTAKALAPGALNKRLCPKDSTAETIASWIHELDPLSDFVFLPQSALSRPLLQKTLEKKHIPHQALAIYTTQNKVIKNFNELLQADELIFTSPSCVKSFYDQTKDLLELSPLIKTTSIGPITELTLQKYIHQSYTSHNPF